MELGVNKVRVVVSSSNLVGGGDGAGDAAKEEEVEGEGEVAVFHSFLCIEMGL